MRGPGQLLAARDGELVQADTPLELSWEPEPLGTGLRTVVGMVNKPVHKRHVLGHGLDVQGRWRVNLAARVSTLCQISLPLHVDVRD